MVKTQRAAITLPFPCNTQDVEPFDRKVWNVEKDTEANNIIK